MFRKISEDERSIALKLVGDKFPELEKLRSQLENCRVSELADGAILEFEVFFPEKFDANSTVLGEGSLDDVDGVPIILTLLQRDGRLWRMDISRADSARAKSKINPENLRTLGYGKRLILG
jgi:hypothetical protein